MRIVTYTAPDAPERERHIAYIFTPAKSKDGTSAETRQGVPFPARTRELARANAEAWWADQQKREADRKLGDAQRAARMKKGRAA